MFALSCLIKSASPRFKRGQKKIIDAVMSGHDVLVVMPTGAGKSLCYQLPSMLLGGHSLVISPLNALMYDQTQKLLSRKINATFINSSLTGDEKFTRLQMIYSGYFKIIYIAPERLFNENNNYCLNTYNSLLDLPYKLLVVDEAHCIDKWGRGFRPAYAKLGELRTRINNPPTIALTASASKITQSIILESLNIPKAKIFVSGFYRPEIKLKVINVSSSRGKGYFHSKINYLNQILNHHKSDKVVIFVLTIAEGEDLKQVLVSQGYQVYLFHSQIPQDEKRQIQDSLSGHNFADIKTIICTSAFGMGIDIPDIRVVVNYSLPSNIEDYYQQIGRAGRDQKRAEAILFYQWKDEDKNRYLLQLGRQDRQDKTKAERLELGGIEEQEIQTMLGYVYAKNNWRYILNYFGEV